MGPVTDEHKLTYQRNVALAVQQKQSMFENAMTYHPGLKGRKAQFLDLIGATTSIMDGNRGGDTPNIDNNLEPIWIVPHQFEWGKLIEKEDAIKALTDYESEFVQAGAAAMARDPDIQLYAPVIFGNRLIGQDGGTSSAYDTTAKVVAKEVGSSDGLTDTGMNVKKIIRGRRYLQAFKIRLQDEELFLGLNAQGIEELYNDITYVNTDYRAKSVLDDKMVLSILGVTIIPTEDIPDFDSTHYASALWCKSGLHYGEFDPVSTIVERNPQKKYRWHPYMERWVGASRSEDKKVIKIVNKK